MLQEFVLNDKNMEDPSCLLPQEKLMTGTERIKQVT